VHNCCLVVKLKARSRDEEEDRLKVIRAAHNTKREAAGDQHTDRMEDYLEVIYELIKQKGYATAVDISESLNVSSPSVTKMLQRLDESKYLRYEKYRGINLTNEGTAVAENIREKSFISRIF
jgi:Mn-dependent DtxR family transcriptional regulator